MVLSTHIGVSELLPEGQAKVQQSELLPEGQVKVPEGQAKVL